MFLLRKQRTQYTMPTRKIRSPEPRLNTRHPSAAQRSHGLVLPAVELRAEVRVGPRPRGDHVPAETAPGPNLTNFAKFVRTLAKIQMLSRLYVKSCAS